MVRHRSLGVSSASQRAKTLSSAGSASACGAEYAQHLISSSIFGIVRHAATAAVYLGLAYAAKLAFGVSLTFNAIR